MGVDLVIDLRCIFHIDIMLILKNSIQKFRKGVYSTKFIYLLPPGILKPCL